MKIQKPLGSNDEQELPFEKSLEKLEGLVKKLESGELSLEDSVKAFAKSTVIVRFHYGKKVDEAEKKVEILLQKDGSLTKEPFNA